MKKNVSGIIWGVCIILFGFFSLGKVLNLWDFNILFKGWWTLFIIVPSLCGLLFENDKKGSLFFMILGFVLLGCANDVFEYANVWKIMLCVLLVIIGLNVFLKSIFGEDKNFISKVAKCEKKGLPNYAGVFGGSSEKITNAKFDGCYLEAVFGSVDIDLRDAKIENDVYIEAACIFGGAEIRVPEGVKVVSSGVNIFGGADNKTKNSKETEKTIYIKTVCVFGGLEVKN